MKKQILSVLERNRKENSLLKSCLTSPLAGEDARRAGEGERGNTLLSPLIGFECLRTQNHFPRQGGSHTAGGFTLIELLVVVLIIGILAAVAVPQYQKAVEKSKAAQALTMLKTVYNAADAYYLANGTHATSFDELAVDVPWTGTTRWMSVGSNAKSNGEWAIQLYNSSGLTEPGVSVGRLSGKYKGAGFIIYLRAAQHSLPKETPMCMEREHDDGVKFSGAAGSYCQQIMKGTFRLEAQNLRWYNLP